MMRYGRSCSRLSYCYWCWYSRVFHFNAVFQKYLSLRSFAHFSAGSRVDPCACFQSPGGSSLIWYSWDCWRRCVHSLSWYCSWSSMSESWERRCRYYPVCFGSRLVFGSCIAAASWKWSGFFQLELGNTHQSGWSGSCFRLFPAVRRLHLGRRFDNQLYLTLKVIERSWSGSGCRLSVLLQQRYCCGAVHLLKCQCSLCWVLPRYC